MRRLTLYLLSVNHRPAVEEEKVGVIAGWSRVRGASFWVSLALFLLSVWLGRMGELDGEGGD